LPKFIEHEQRERLAPRKGIAVTLPELIKVLPAGVKLWRVHDRLAVDAPAGTLTPALRSALILHKPAILAAMILSEEFHRPRPRLRAVVLRSAQGLGFPHIDLLAKEESQVGGGAAAWVTFVIGAKIGSVIEAGLRLDAEVERQSDPQRASPKRREQEQMEGFRSPQRGTVTSQHDQAKDEHHRRSQARDPHG
jgi:hypothetical protein